MIAKLGKRLRAPSSEQMLVAQARLKAAQEVVNTLAARASETERKKDTRRKIVLGGALMTAAIQDEIAADLLQRFVAAALNRDKAVFEGWSLPMPTVPSDSSSLCSPHRTFEANIDGNEAV